MLKRAIISVGKHRFQMGNGSDTNLLKTVVSLPWVDPFPNVQKKFIVENHLDRGELDTVVSGPSEKQGLRGTFIERKTHLYNAIPMPDRTARSMEIAFGAAASSYPVGALQTATTDRGKDFACSAILEAVYGVQVYFADLYSSWQRGSNENDNGLLREFFPKGTDFAQVRKEEWARALYLINHENV